MKNMLNFMNFRKIIVLPILVLVITLTSGIGLMALEEPGHILISNPDPYMKVNTDNKHLVLSGGTGWCQSGGVIVLHGKDETWNRWGITLLAGNKAALGITSDANSYFYGTVYAPNYSCSSDFRFKKDITPVSNSLNKLCALNGVFYNWKKDEFKDKGFSDKRQIGFIAQDVEKIFPELVLTDDSGYKSMIYDKMSVVIVEAIKEMKIKNDIATSNMEKMISNLEKENTALKAENAGIR